MLKRVRPTLFLYGCALLALLPIVAQAQDATWLLNPGSGDWNTPGNWNPATVPTGTATFDTSNTTAVSLSANAGVNGVTFNSTASAFTITASPTFTLTLSGTGITNNSGITQNFVTAADASGNGSINFSGSATAGSNTVFTNNGATVAGGPSGETAFVDTSTAGSATINNNAGTVDNALGGLTGFADTSTAGSAIINNNGGAFFDNGGATSFRNNSTAGSATINNNAGTTASSGGVTVFQDTATAGSATINNMASTVSHGAAGQTIFQNTSTAGSATINNNGGVVDNTDGGSTSFNNTSTAGSATINNNGATGNGAFGGETNFHDTSTASSATITNIGGTVAGAGLGETSFNDSSTADGATITNTGGTVALSDGGETDFSNTSTAASATIINNGGTVVDAFGGETNFHNTSTAGGATINNNGGAASGADGGETQFNDGSTANSAIINNNAATVTGGFGGLTEFNNSSTAGTATVNNNGATVAGADGGEMEFSNTSTAAGATLIANGGTAGGGGGSITFADDSSGGTSRVEVFGNGELDISPHSATPVDIGSLEGSGNAFLGGNQLVIGGNNMSTTFSGVIQDGGVSGGTGGSLTKVGTGALTLSGTNTFTGGTTIKGGTLVVDSLHALSSGDVTLFDHTGTLETRDNVPRTFDVGGNFADSAGTLRMQIGGINSGVNSDLMAVTGFASLGFPLGASSLFLHRINNFMPAPGDSVIIITAAGGVTGAFNSVGNDFSGLIRPIVITNPNDVTIDFELLGSFRSQALTPNQAAVAADLDRAANDPRAADLISFLGSTNVAHLPADFDLIAPEELASIYEIGFSQSVVHNQDLMRRMDDIRAGTNGYGEPVVEVPTGKDTPAIQDKNVVDKNPAPEVVSCPDYRWSVYATGSGDFAHVGDDDFNAHGYNIETGSVISGVDFRIGNHFAIGIDGTYSGSTADLINNGRIDMNGGGGDFYATFFGKGLLGSRFYVDGAVGGGWNDYDTRRTGLMGLDVTGHTDSTQFNALIAYGSDWTFGAFNIGTWSSLQYVDVSLDSFQESGSLAPLSFPDQDEDALRSTSGAHASYDFHLGRCMIIRPEVRAAWDHEYNDRAYPIDAELASGAGNIFRVHGPSIGRDAALIGAGVNVQWCPRVSTYVYYDGVLGRANYDSNAVSAGLRVSF